MIIPILPEDTKIYGGLDGTLWIEVKDRSQITIPQYIKGIVKGHFCKDGNKLFRQIIEFKHPNASLGQYYYADDPHKHVILRNRYTRLGWFAIL